MADHDTEDESCEDEWVLILSMWDNDRRGFERPALERFGPDNREQAQRIHQEYAENDGLHPSDYTLTRRENVEHLPFEVSFDDCNDRFVGEGAK